MHYRSLIFALWIAFSTVFAAGAEARRSGDNDFQSAAPVTEFLTLDFPANEPLSSDGAAPDAPSPEFELSEIEEEDSAALLFMTVERGAIDFAFLRFAPVSDTLLSAPSSLLIPPDSLRTRRS